MPAANPDTTSVKRPALTLHLPDPAPLRETIAAIEAEPAKLQKLLAEKERLETEIAAYIESGDPDPAAARLQQIAGLRVRVEMMPTIEAKLKRDQEAVNAKLYPLIEPFITGIIGEGMAEESAWHDLVAAHIAPYAPTLHSAPLMAEQARLQNNLATLLKTHAPGNQDRSAEIAHLQQQLAALAVTVNHSLRLARDFPWRTIIPGIFGTLRELLKPDARGREAQYHNISPTEIIKRREDNLQHDLRRAQRVLDLHALISQDGRFYHSPDEVPAVAQAAIERAIASERKTEAEQRQAEQRQREETEAAQKAWQEKSAREAAERENTSRVGSL